MSETTIKPGSINVKLPNLPSKLVSVALRDVEDALKIENYEFDLDSWHSFTHRYKGGNKCSICLAGGIIARSVGFKYANMIDPSYFGHNAKIKLEALDVLITRGSVVSFLDTLDYLKGYSHGIRKRTLLKDKEYRKLYQKFDRDDFQLDFELLRKWCLDVIEVLQKYERGSKHV